ncbi:fumarylacetoacetate hydrolase family protein [Xanthobacter sp. V0B-10]|uniref:fumarylacetoacetate hydrolase family protein n=1 Tax=Xanthobacter albus TaxID=3119929 RepID=UPI0037276131
MKLVRFGAKGAEKPGLIDAAGRVRDLSGHVPELSGAALSPAGLARLAALDPEALPLAPAGARLGPCVPQPGNFIAIGLNFADHAAETGNPIPAEPVVFNKAPNCISGPNDDIITPKDSTKLDWEVELAFVIGTRARHVEEKDALSHIAGYCICNDVSERGFQMERAGQWTKGKGCESFGPVGPWLVTPDELGDTADLTMKLDVNGARMQDGSTRTMIFRVPFLLSYLSRFMVLDPGDIVTTGTPPGVGLGYKPPRFLKAGDVVTLSVAGLGEQRQTVVPFQP